MEDLESKLEFSLQERDFLSFSLQCRWDPPPMVEEGWTLKNWRDGPERGKPRIRKPMVGLLARGLVRIEERQPWSRWFLTEHGKLAVKKALETRKTFSGKEFDYLREQLSA